MEQKEDKHSLTQQDIERHLQSALAAATPNVWPKLDLCVPQDKPAKNAAVLRLRRRFARWGAAAACVVLLIFGGVYHYEYLQVASVVGIDVNPSLQISLNRREQVLKAEALNSDGAKVLDTELKGKSLESAVSQVVDSLVDKGYLKEGQQEQAVLVSVSGKNGHKAEKVKLAVTANMENAISQKKVSAVVYDQTIQVTKELEELAEAYQVSVGKAEFIERLVQENETLIEDVPAAYERMMGQTIQDLSQEIDACAYSVSPRVTVIQVEPADEKKSRSDGREKNSRETDKENASETAEEPAASGADNAEVKEEENVSAENIREDRKEDTERKDNSQRTEEEKESAERPEETSREQTEPIKKNTVDRTRETSVQETFVSEETDKSTEALQEETSEAEETGREASSSTAGAEETAEEAEETAEEAEETEQFVEYGYPSDADLWLLGNPDGEELPPLAEQKQEETEENKIEETNETPPSFLTEVEKQESSVLEDENNDEKDDLILEDKVDRETVSAAGKADETAVSAAEESFGEKQADEGSSAVLPKENQDDRESLSEEKSEQDNLLTAEERADQNNLPLMEEERADQDSLPLTEERADQDSLPLTEERADQDSLPLTEERADQDSLPSAEGNVGQSELSSVEEKDEQSEADALHTETEADTQRSASRIIRTAEDIIDNIEPGDMAKTRKKGRQMTSNGTMIIFEEAEKKEYKPPVYASQLLSAAQSRLLRKGPGMFEFIVADPGSKKHGEDYSEDEQDFDAEDEWVLD